MPGNSFELTSAKGKIGGCAPYKLADSDRYYFVILEAAKGKALRSLIKDAAASIKNPTEFGKKLNVITMAYRQFGRVMREFHQKFKAPNCQKVFCPTVIHGDLHYENVFFDPDGKIISLIDTESMANGISQKADPMNDLTRFYYFSVAIADPRLRVPDEFVGNEAMEKTLGNATFKAFLEGYLETVTGNNRT